MTEEQKIPPKEEWPQLNTNQLFELKSNLLNRYYDLRSINASFAPQFLAFAQHVDVLLERQEQIRLAEQQEQAEARQ